MTARTVGHWSHLRREAVDSPALGTFASPLDRVRGHLV